MFFFRVCFLLNTFSPNTFSYNPSNMIWEQKQYMYIQWSFLVNPDFIPDRFLNQADLARDKLWCNEIYAAVRETKNRINTVCFLALFYWYMNSCFCIFFLINPWWLIIFCCLSFNPYFIEKMLSSNNWLLYKFSQICSTLCTLIQRLYSKMVIDQNIILIRNIFSYSCVNIVILSKDFLRRYS